MRDALQRILAHAPFKRSPVLSRFLSHVVEHALTSDAPPLKEFTLGLEVFDRPDDFDPRIDTIVRVQARRLRDALATYYQNDGQHDAVRLDMPKGHYGIRARPAGDVDDAVRTSRSEAQPESKQVFTPAPLPAARTPLIGRGVELEQLIASLRDEDTRLVTISGVGGSGKTRLALTLADTVQNAFPAGVLFLDLSAVTERAVLVNMLADVFNARHVHETTLLQGIADSVRSKLSQPLLLVMDNMEGVLDAADVLGELLDASPLLTILATSRLALRLYGEHEFPLPPLAVPDQSQRSDAAGLAAVPAVQLFLMRAAAANPHADFEGHMATLAELCVRLDGLPLAIELVAAQAIALTPEQMLQRFTGHLDLPENPARDAPSRQRTLRRTIDWSHELLDDAGRRALRRLSVFAGGFTLEAAEAVADADADMGDELVPAFNTLVAMGLVYFRSDTDEPRYAMLETLRAYGLERLAASTESDSVRKAHAAYCLVLAEEGIGTLNAGQRERWLARCDLEQDNFRLALEYVLRHGPPLWALRLGQALFAFWERREKLAEGRRLLCQIGDTVPPETDRSLWAKVTIYAAVLIAFQGDDPAANERFEKARHLYRQLGDRKGEASALLALGVNARLRGADAQALPWLEQCLALCRELGEPDQIAGALSNVAECQLRLGRTGIVRELLQESHELFKAAGDDSSAAWSLNHLGDAERVTGNFDRAARHYAQAEVEFERLGDAWGLARTKVDFGRLALDRARPEAAPPLLLDALRAFELLDHQRGLAQVADTLAAWARESDQLELGLRLVAAAESWRAAVGFTGRRADLKFARELRSHARGSLDNETMRRLHEAGRVMSVADVTAAVREVIDNSGD